LPSDRGSERPKKSPFAGQGSWNANDERAPEPSRPRSPALVAMIGTIAMFAAAIAIFVATQRPRPPSAIAPAAGEAAQAAGTSTTPVPSPMPVEPPTPEPAVAPPVESAPPATPSASSGAARDDASVVLRARSRIKQCFEEALKVSPGAGGRATLTLDVGADGRVSSASVTGARPPSLGACIQKVAASSTFAPGEPRKVTMPLALTSQ
jgi:hypothetical protein